MRSPSAVYRDQTDPLVARRAAEQYGVLTLDELVACGLSKHAVSRRVAAGFLHRIHRAVYAVGHTGLTTKGRWLAAVKAAGAEALLARASGGMLLGFLSLDDRRPEVSVPEVRRRSIPGILVHRTRSVHPTTSSPPASRTELEDRVHDVVLAGGFAPPDVNVPLRLGGRRIVPDLRWPARRLVIEADSRQWHENPQARADDAERQALLEAHGERVVRVTWEQAVLHTAQTIARIAHAGAPPG